MPDIHNYQPPVDQLLTYGKLDVAQYADWPNYLDLGFTEADIPALIRLATDAELHQSDMDKAEGWAPVHAWRALGQLRAVEAIEPLMSLYDIPDIESNEWVIEEWPDVFGLMGPAAIPALAAFVADKKQNEGARSNAATGLRSIVE